MSRLRGAPAAAAGIVVSRLSGLVRAALVTNILGVGTVGDAFAAAIRIPNVLQNLLGEGALSAAFVPAYSSQVDEDREAAGRTAGAVASFLFLLTSLLVLLGVLAARPITRVIAWGFDGERFELTVTLVRVIALGTGLLVMTAWCLSILNSHRRFFLSYVAPAVWNMVQIGTLVAVAAAGWAAVDMAEALAWALVAGAGAQLLLQLPAVIRANRHIRPASPLLPDARAVISRFGPAVMGRGALQISGFLDLALATLLSVGAAAALAASQTLYILPLSVIGLSVVATELPELSRMNDDALIADRVRSRLLSTGFLITGVTAIYLTSAVPIVDSVVNLGGFRNSIDGDDVRLIAYSLGIFALGLPALVGSRLLQNVCFASGDTSTPARIALIRVTVSLLVGASLMFPLDRVIVLNGALSGFGDLEASFSPLADSIRHDPALPTRLGAVGLAIGGAVGAWIEFAALRGWVLQRWGREGLLGGGAGRHVAPLVGALVAGVAMARFTGLSQPLVEAGVLAGVTGVVYLAIGLLVRCEGARALAFALRRSTPPSAAAEEDATP